MDVNIGMVISFAAVIAVLIFRKRILDVLNIPRSKIDYAVVLTKQDGIYGVDLFMVLEGNRVTFEFKDHTSVNLKVPRKAFDNVRIGSRGVLLYSGDRFRGFHVDKKITNIVKSRKKAHKNDLFEDWLKK